MTSSAAAAGTDAPDPRTRFSAVVARLTGANVLVAAAGFITGPLLAYGLGASGRGDLAAVVVPLGLAPFVLNLGIPTFATREAARGRPLREIIGSCGVPLLAVGLLSLLLAAPVADALAGGRESVRSLLIAVFLAMPALLIGSLLVGCAAGLERWNRVVLARVIPVAISLTAITVLTLAGELSVVTAGAFAIVGAILAATPALALLWEGGRPRFVAPYALEGIRFGLKTWIGNLALLANGRLDQLVMITAVAPRELGLYVVAVTVGGASSALTTAITPPLITRIAEGHLQLVPRALRITLAITILLNLMLAALTPALLPLLFGSDFREAVPMALVLLAAAVPFAGANILGAALQADGAPGIPSIGEGIALGITVIGLIVLLGPLGGLGAAITSAAAYTASFAFQLVITRRRIPASALAYLVPTAADVRWARSLL